MTVKRRLIGAFGASVLGPMVTVVIQLVNVPVMLRLWGASLYGEWLLISTIPAYLLLTDLGFGNVAGSDMTMRSSAGDRRGAIETFQSITALVLAVSLTLGLLLTILIFFLPLYSWLHFSAMTPQEMKLALFIVCINCLIVLQWSVIMAGYRCDGQYARGILYVNILRILEGVSFLVLLVTRSGPVHLALLMLGISLLGTAGLLVAKRRFIPWLPVGIKHASWHRIRELAHPAFAFMAFPAGSALSQQGTTVLVGILLGPVAVAVFNPMRTLTRTVFQLTDAAKSAVWPELSAAYGRQDWDLARKLHRTASQVAIWLALLASLGLAFFGPKIFTLWTHGRVVMNLSAFYILLLVVAINSVWNASSAVPIAANRHQRLAMIYLGCTACTFLAAFLLTRVLGLPGTAAALLLSEIGMSLFVLRMSNRLVHDTFVPFARSMFDFSQLQGMLRRKPQTAGPSMIKEIESHL